MNPKNGIDAEQNLYAITHTQRKKKGTRMPLPLDFFASVTIFFLLHQSAERSCTQFSQPAQYMVFVRRTSHQAQSGLDPPTAAHQAQVSTNLGRPTQAVTCCFPPRLALLRLLLALL